MGVISARQIGFICVVVGSARVLRDGRAASPGSGARRADATLHPFHVFFSLADDAVEAGAFTFLER